MNQPSMTNPASKDELRNWLAQAKIKRTIESLLLTVKQSGDSELINAVLHQSNRYHDLKQLEAADTQSSENIQIEKRKIVDALLTIIDNADDEVFSTDNSLPTNQTKNKIAWYKHPILVGAAILCLAISVYIIFQNQNDQTPNPTEIVELKKIADGYFDAELWNDAEDAYIRLINIEPKNTTFLEKYGYCLYRNNRYDEAKKTYDKAIEISEGKKYTLFYHRANLNLMGLKNYPAALEDYNTLMKIVPNHKAGINHRGLAYQAMGEIENACKDFKRALELGNNTAKINITKYCQ